MHRGERSFSFETVMSHLSKVEILASARETGFFAQLWFVGTDDPQTNVERVALRVAQGGHDVPRERIVARWKRTMELLSEAIRSANEAFVFDNSVDGTVEAVPRLVFHRNLSTKGERPWSEHFLPCLHGFDTTYQSHLASIPFKSKISKKNAGCSSATC
jgi:predicted ABC-type ATPase